MLVLDTSSMAKVLANKDESKCLKPLIAVIRPVRDRYIYDQVFINEAVMIDEKGTFYIVFYQGGGKRETTIWTG